VLQRTPEHWLGSELPVARFPPPSALPSTAWMPQPLLPSAVFDVNI
jgi:hypothetical protein